MLGRTPKRDRVAAWITAGALVLGSGYVVSAEESAWEKVKDAVGMGEFDVKMIEGEIVSLGDHIVLNDQQRQSMGNNHLFADGPVGLRTKGGDLYLILPGRYNNVQLDRLSFEESAKHTNKANLENQQEPPRATDTRVAGERETRGPQTYDTGTATGRQPTADAEVNAVTTDAATIEREQKLREATADARSHLDSTIYETQIDSLNRARVGQRVAVIGQIYSGGGLQAILTDTIHADQDGAATQARAE